MSEELKSLIEKRDAYRAKAKEAMAKADAAVKADNGEEANKHLDEAERYNRLAKVTQEEVEAQEAANAKSGKTRNQRRDGNGNSPPFGNGDGDGDGDAVHAAHVHKYGDNYKAAVQMAKELYPEMGTGGDEKDFAALSKAKAAEFYRYMNDWQHDPDPTLKNLVLVSDAQIAAYSQHGAGIDHVKAEIDAVKASTGGAFVVPADFQNRVIERQSAMATIRPGATVLTTQSSRVEIPTSKGGDDRYPNAVRVTWTEPVAASAEQAEYELGLKSIDVKEVFTYLDLPLTLIEDAGFNIVQWVTMSFPKAMALNEDTKFIFGNGNREPLGILKRSGNNWVKRFDETVEYTTAAAGEFGGDDVIAIPLQLVKQHRMGASCWLTSSGVLSEILRIKNNDGTYQFTNTMINMPGAEGGKDSQYLRGYIVEEQEDFNSATVSGDTPLLFLNKAAVYIVDRIGHMMERFRDSGTGSKVRYQYRNRKGAEVAEPWKIVAAKIQ